MRPGPHWHRQRTLLARAARALVAQATADARTPADLGIARQDWSRLEAGTAGFALLVKIAERLQLDVTIAFHHTGGSHGQED